MLRLTMMTEVLTKFGFSTKEAFKYIKDSGYEAIDVTLMEATCYRNPKPELFGDDYKEVAEDLKNYAKELNIPLVQAHAPFPVHIEGDDEYNKNMFQTLIKSLEICGILGVPYCVIHPWNKWNSDQNKDFFNLLLPYAKKYNVKIATENMWNWDIEHGHASLAAASSPKDFLDILEKVNDPFLVACVDVGHANMFTNWYKEITPKSMIETLGHDHVKCLHLHDNDYIYDLHQVPYHGSMNWDEVIEALRNINYDGELVLETSAHNMPKEAYLSMVKHQLDVLKIIKKRIEE